MYIVEYLIRGVFPKRPSQSLVEHLSELNPTRKKFISNGLEVTYLFDYQDKITRALITEAKFHNNYHARKLLATALFSTLGLKLRESVVVPMPLSRRRQMKRGYNQVAEILVAAKVEHYDILRRRHRPPQIKLPREKRLINQHNSIWLPDKHSKFITGQNVCLIDDVVTTGATITAAQAELARHNPNNITCIALAH